MRSVVKWFRRTAISVCRRASIFHARLPAGNTAHDALAVGGAPGFRRLACVCMKRRTITPVGERCSRMDGARFNRDRHMEGRRFSPFSHALLLTAPFAALPECRSCPEVCSRRFVLLGALDASLRWGTYPIRTVVQFSRNRDCYRNSLTKKQVLSRISKR